MIDTPRQYITYFADFFVVAGALVIVSFFVNFGPLALAVSEKANFFGFDTNLWKFSKNIFFTKYWADGG